MNRDEHDARMAAEHQHEQELLQQDPAYLLWLAKVDADQTAPAIEGDPDESDCKR